MICLHINKVFFDGYAFLPEDTRQYPSTSINGQYHFMFKRHELEEWSLEDLQNLCINRFGLIPLGNLGCKESYIVALSNFATVAIQQVKERKGLKMPNTIHLDALNAMLDAIGTATPEQSALILSTMEGRNLQGTDKCYQDKLFALYRVRWYLEQIREILTTPIWE